MSRRSAGFTLIELMIALVVSTIMVVPLYMLTRSLNRQADAQAKGVEAMERARTAMSVISEDLRRAGLSVSPNPAADFASFTRNNPSAAGYSRRAVVHLPEFEDSPGQDQILLVGNFLGSDTYRARALGDQLSFQEDMDDPDDCERQFSGDYAFAHVFGPNNASVDMKIVSASHTANRCIVTLAPGERTDQAYVDGDEVWVAANQAVLYRVEQNIDDHDGECDTVSYELVRYFVDYTSSAASPCDIQEIPVTRQVVASYVSDFQVWFRPVTLVQDATDNRTRLELHAYNPGELHDEDWAFSRPADHHYFTQDPDPVTSVVEDEDFSCSDEYEYGPEHVRSAMVRLSIRTENPALDLDYRPFLDDPTGTEWGEDFVTGRRPLFTMAPYVDPEIGASQCPGGDGATYKLKTLVTEVLMPNLAARSDMLATN